MSSGQVATNTNHSESKSAKKKKAKAAAAVTSPGTPDADLSTAADPTTNGSDASSESPYLRELNKNIRNVKKKLNATQKVDAILSENPDSSLDDLLAAKKINADQKAQAQKKPGLQAQLAQYEEQVAQYKQFDEEYQKRFKTEKAALETTHQEEIDKVKAATVSEVEALGKQQAKDNLLVLSKFLRAAAAKRQDGDEASAQNRAFEGALLLVYGGEVAAVAAMENLIAGSEEKVPAVDGTLSDFDYKQVRDLSIEHQPYQGEAYATEEAWAEDVAQSNATAPPGEEPSTQQTTAPPKTDPTLAHAGLTEIDAPSTNTETQTNGISSAHTDAPTASGIDNSAANNSGSKDWEAKLPTNTNGSGEDWVQVERDPAETDTGNSATLAGQTGTQSWAEDVPAATEPEMPTPAYAQPPAAEDGFREVHHHQHRASRSRGGWEHRGERRGRGGPRGDRGDGRGGRGGYRGDRERGRGGRGRGGDGGPRGRGRGGGGGGGGPPAASGGGWGDSGAGNGSGGGWDNSGSGARGGGGGNWGKADEGGW